MAQAPADATLVVSGVCSNEVGVLCSDPSLDVVILSSNHEEADRKVVLHTVNLKGHVNNVAIVSTRDKDMLLLLLVDMGGNFKEAKVHTFGGGLSKSSS